jgi:hypothetical protein
MSKFVDKVIKVGSLGTIDDASGLGAAEKAADIQTEAGRAALARQELSTGQARDVLLSSGQQARDFTARVFGETTPLLQRGEQRFTDTLRGTEATALEDLTRLAGQSQEQFQPFQVGGAGAAEQQAALSGALGPEAQQAAFAAFNQSPGTQFLQDQQERALTRNAAAGLSLGGGNVLSALQEQAFGRAQTDFGNQFNRLGQVAERGQSAAGNISNIINQLSSNRANIINQTGQNIAGAQQQTDLNTANLVERNLLQRGGLETNLATALANLATGSGSQQANTLQQIGQFQASPFQQQANLSASLLGQVIGAGGDAGAAALGKPPGL